MTLPVQALYQQTWSRDSMPFGSHILSALEDALSNGFEYHNQLDAFLLRSGLSQADLNAARSRAETKNKKSPRGYDKAPKRFVVQEALNQLSLAGEAGDRIVAALITAILRTPLPSQSDKSARAIKLLNAHQQEDKRERDAKTRQDQEQRERDTERVREQQTAERAAAREKLRQDFIALAAQTDAQTRGYALEKFLNELFKLEKLTPREPFRIQGEQIDGSLVWQNRTYLVEAKWTKTPAAGAEFAALIFKIDGKTADTRGLYVSVNGYSPDAVAALQKKGNLRFVCVDGTHLMQAVEAGGSISAVMEELWRHADETGEPYLPASKMGRRR